MKYRIITFGCQMNKSDSERLASQLEKKGYTPAVKKQSADLVVINACSVRQSAINRVYGQINNLRKLKKKPRIVVTGCILKIDRQKLTDRVDEIWEFTDLELQPKHTPKAIAYIPIMTGCNNFCSYCAVPYTRGREVSRKAQNILRQINKIVKHGCGDIVLLGQNVNSYKSARTDFPKLLENIDKLSGRFTIRFLTFHPKDLSDKLIAVMAASQKIIKELHLPIQSGDNNILKKMNRGYTVGQYKKLINKLRKKIPDIKITTDIIVGFPSETTQQFKNTYKVCQEIKFAKAYIAQYSPRHGTAAAKLNDNISQQEKKKRWLKLESLINKNKQLFN